jgi:ribosome modulation factor
MTPFDGLDIPDFLNRRKRKEIAMPVTAKIEHAKGATLPDLTKEQPGTVSNGPSREDFLFMVGREIDHRNKVKEERAKHKRFRQFCSNQGVNLKAMDIAIAEREREDGTTLDNLKDQKRYFEFLGLPLGHQFSFFDAPTSAATAPDILKKAHDEGYELGLMGKAPDDQKYPPITPEGQEHMRGWNDAQSIHLAKFKTLEDGMTEVERAAKKAAEDKAKKKAERAAKKAQKNGADPDAGEGEGQAATAH